MDNIYNLLTEEEKAKIRTFTYSKDEIIYHEDTLCNEVCIVLSGLVKISTYSYQGNEIIFNQLTAGSLFGNNLLFSSDQKYKGDVVSKIDGTQIVIIKKDQLLEILQTNKDFLISYLNKQSDFGKHLNQQIKILGFDSAEERFLYFLSSNGNKIKIKSVTRLAEDLFLTRETVSRLISKLSEENIIKFENKMIEYIG